MTIDHRPATLVHFNYIAGRSHRSTCCSRSQSTGHSKSAVGSGRKREHRGRHGTVPCECDAGYVLTNRRAFHIDPSLWPTSSSRRHIRASSGDYIRSLGPRSVGGSDGQGEQTHVHPPVLLLIDLSCTQFGKTALHIAMEAEAVEPEILGPLLAHPQANISLQDEVLYICASNIAALPTLTTACALQAGRTVLHAAIASLDENEQYEAVLTQLLKRKEFSPSLVDRVRVLFAAVCFRVLDKSC